MPRRKVTPKIMRAMRRFRGGLSYGKIVGRLGLPPMTGYNHLQKRVKLGCIGELKRKLSSE